MLNVYIYYRVAEATGAKAAVTELFANIKQCCGITPRLLQRTDDPATWMEVYEGIADPYGFMTTLAAAEAAAGIRDYLVAGTKRITERFVPVAGS